MVTVFDWSDQQLAIFDEVVSGNSNVVVDARAGSAKTTTAVESVIRTLARANHTNILVCAFNTRIKDELERKLAHTKAVVKSTHQIGYSMVRSAFHGANFVHDKGAACAMQAVVDSKRVWGKRDQHRWAGRTAKLASLAKSTLATTEDELLQLAIDHEIGSEEYPEHLLVGYAQEALQLAINDPRGVDHDDQLWLPARYDLRVTNPFDLVVADEAQDWSKVQLWLAQRCVKHGGKLLMLADPNQAIYGWRGADHEAVPRMIRELDAKIMPLTTSYRCPASVVKLASRIVPDFHSAPNAPQGLVRRTTWGDLISGVKPGDFILSRSNAALMSAAIELLDEEKRVVIAGVDLVTIIERLLTKSRAGSVSEFKLWVQTYREEQVKQLQDEFKQREAQEVDDRCRMALVLAARSATIAEIAGRASTLFGDMKDTGDKVVCSSIHRAKGFERHTVWVLRDTLLKFDQPEERRIVYVAFTRAQSQLMLVDGLPASIAAADPKPNPTREWLLGIDNERAHDSGVITGGAE